MTTGAGKVRRSTAAGRGNRTCEVQTFKVAIKALNEAIESTKDAKDKQDLEDWVNVLTDVCIMMSGFGAALKAKAKSS